MLGLYALVYVLCGLAAIAVWVFAKTPSTLVKNLATISIGLFLAVTRTYLNGPPPS
jgi:hypothetical protein